MTYQYGARPSRPDKRDYPVSAFLPTTYVDDCPSEYALPYNIGPYDQGNTSMCVDFSAREAAEIFSWKELGYWRPLSNGYIYGNRAADAYHGEGMEPRDAMDTWCKYGIPPADVYNVTGTYDQCKAYYDTHKVEADAAAKPQRLLKHAVCFTPAEVKGALYHLQSPVMITVIVTGLFETALFMRRDGQIPVEPSRNYEEGAMTFKGYHEMVVVAYKPIDGVLYYGCLNSWGKLGDSGKVWVRADDPRIVEMRTVTDKPPRGRKLSLTIGGDTATLSKPVDDDAYEVTDTVKMDVAPFIKDGRTVVPLRFISTGLAKLIGKPVAIMPIYGEDGKTTGVDIILLEE